MNSMPLISHHLFVAAVGSDGRSQERSRKRGGVSEQADRPRTMPVQIANEYGHPPANAPRPLPPRVTQRRD